MAKVLCALGREIEKESSPRSLHHDGPDLESGARSAGLDSPLHPRGERMSSQSCEGRRRELTETMGENSPPRADEHTMLGYVVATRATRSGRLREECRIASGEIGGDAGSGIRLVLALELHRGSGRCARPRRTMSAAGEHGADAGQAAVTLYLRLNFFAR